MAGRRRIKELFLCREIVKPLAGTVLLLVQESRHNSEAEFGRDLYPSARGILWRIQHLDTRRTTFSLWLDLSGLIPIA